MIMHIEVPCIDCGGELVLTKAPDDELIIVCLECGLTEPIDQNEELAS
jgi:uncharacterized Zn finger protein